MAKILKVLNMFCRQVFGNISGGFRGISRKYLNFAGPRLREISEALSIDQSAILTASRQILHHYYGIFCC